jgi:hypothetical protein
MRRLLPLLLTGVLVTGCSEAQEAVSGATDCAGLAADVARTGLNGVPTQEEATEAVDRLDRRVSELDDGDVRDAATTLRDRLRELQEAARTADPAGVQTAAEQAREAARDTAQACGLPVDQFLG